MEACSRQLLAWHHRGRGPETAALPSIIGRRQRPVYRLVFLEPVGTAVTVRYGATMLSSLSDAFKTVRSIQQRSARPGTTR
jgi:hypothetical protein